MTTPSRSPVIVGAVGLLGLAALAVGYAQDARQVMASYLFAFVCAFTLVVGALMQVMISDVTGASWFETLRLRALRVSGALPLLVLLILPVLLNLDVLYAWVSPATLPPDVRLNVARKAAWLNVPFFVIRALLYLAVWIAMAELLRRAGAGARANRVSALGLVAVAFAFTFASFDWVMSLEPAWYSTIYGVYLFAGGISAALAWLAISANGRAIESGALGKLMVTFAMFWMYIAFSQYLIIWIADIPAEVTWYAARLRGGWRALAGVLLFGHFVVPCLVLFPYRPKRNPRVMHVMGYWMLLMHILDCYWFVMPVFDTAGPAAHWTDIAALLAVGGLLASVGLWRTTGAESMERVDLHPLAASVSGS